jgi:hypothetical protein
MTDVSDALEAAFGEPAPLSFDANLASWCERARKELIEYEVQFSDPEWTFLRQMEAHKDALDALREINPGCGCEFATTRCGKPLHEGTPHRLFCDECNTKREAAIDRLISETGEGGNG